MALSRASFACLPLLALAACASAQTTLKQPLAQQCSSAGLNGCQGITDAIVLYVTANGATRAEAAMILKEGAAVNAPEDTRAFANNLALVVDAPNAATYADRLRNVAALLRRAADETEDAPQMRTAKGSTY